jgi:hypothetical protein
MPKYDKRKLSIIDEWIWTGDSYLPNGGVFTENSTISLSALVKYGQYWRLEFLS